jgi:hypothetical protein
LLCLFLVVFLHLPLLILHGVFLFLLLLVFGLPCGLPWKPHIFGRCKDDNSIIPYHSSQGSGKPQSHLVSSLIHCVCESLSIWPCKLSHKI